MKVLIIGVSSFLGQKIWKYFSDAGFELIGTYYKNDLNNENFVQLNLSSYREIKNLLNKINPESIILLSVISSKESEINKGYALEINSLSVGYIASWCLENHKHLIYTSSEAVFDGQNSPYYEWSQCNPINFYGKTKSLAETIIKTIDCNFSIIRLPRLYGYNHRNDREIPLKKILKALSHNQIIKLDNKRIEFPTLADDVAKNLTKITKEKIKGIFHFSASEAHTTFEFGLKVAEIFCFDRNLLHESFDSNMIPRPFKVQLINNNKFCFLSVKEGLYFVKNQILKDYINVKEALL